jgi:hypothetical protein
MKISDYAKAQGWLKRHASSENSTGEWEKYVALNTTPELDEAIKTIDDKFGPGTVFPASEAPIPPMTDQQAIFEFGQRNPQADGGRIGFYKGSFVEGEGWVVRFASPTMKSKGIEMDDKWFGKQVFETEEAMNAAIEERKKISKKNTELKNKKLAERNTREAEKGYKKIIDDFIEKGDYENFKSEIYESQMKKKIRSGKLRQTKGGRVPTHIVKFIRERLDAGPGTDLFEDLKRITGRTEEELLEFSKNIGPSEFTKTGKRKNVMPIKQRSESAIESWPEDRKLTDEEKLEGERKQKEARKIKEAVGTKYASELELKNSKKIEKEISNLNAMFKNDPNLINDPKHAKLKEMMEIQIAGKDKTLPSGKKVKAGELFRREVDSKGNLITDDYYIKKAKEGKIMSFFDINKVGTQMGKYATNINITPSLFNSAFIQGQVETYFKKGGKFYGDAEKLKKVDDYLKSVGVKVKITDVGRIGGGDPVFYDSKTGNFPHITKTLNTMGIQDDVLTQIKGDTKFVKSVGKDEAGFISGELLEDTAKGFKKVGSVARKLGAEFEAAFIGADFLNNLDNGMDTDTAFQTALENATLGLYKGGQRAQWEDFKNAGKELGHNPENLSEVKNIIDLEKMLKKEKENLNNLKNYLESGDPTLIDDNLADLQKKIEAQELLVPKLEKKFKDRLSTFKSKDNSQDIISNYQDTVGYVARKEYNKNVDNALLDKGKKYRVNPEMGSIGSPLWESVSDLRTYLPQNLMETSDVLRPVVRGLRKLPGVFGDIWDPTSEQAKLSAMSAEEIEQRAKALNIQKQNYHPVTGNTMTEQQMEPYYERYYSNGGIAGVKKVNPDELKEAQEKMKKLMKQYKNKNLDWDAVKRSYKIWTK